MSLFETLGYYIRLLRSSLYQRPQQFLLSESDAAKGLNAVVTGGNAGIGLETVRQLALLGCNVILACRDTSKGKAALKKIESDEGRELPISILQLDLADLDSVALFAKDVQRELQGKKLDILVHNGGVCEVPYAKSKQGHELTFATNHLGPYLLTKLLLGSIQSPGGRIVFVNAELHTLAKDASSDYLYSDTGLQSYCRSKLAQMWYAYELQRSRLDLVIPVLHPGVIATKMNDKAPKFIQRWLFLTPREGSQTTLYCCLHPEVQGLTYYHNSLGVLPSSRASHDREKARALLQLSDKLTAAYI